MPDREERRAVNERALRDPKPGDYWHEMFTPIARVIGVTNGYVVLHNYCDGGLIRNKDGSYSENTAKKPVAKSLRSFRRWLSYNTIPGTWADCEPERFAEKDI